MEDFFYLYRGQVFVWNTRKQVDNFAKHGIHFEAACEVFFDQWSAFVDASIPEESRLALIGISKDRKFLYVVHTVSEKDIVRVISAREATAHERRIYEDGE